MWPSDGTIQTWSRLLPRGVLVTRPRHCSCLVALPLPQLQLRQPATPHHQQQAQPQPLHPLELPHAQLRYGTCIAWLGAIWQRTFTQPTQCLLLTQALTAENEALKAQLAAKSHQLATATLYLRQLSVELGTRDAVSLLSIATTNAPDGGGHRYQQDMTTAHLMGASHY